MKPRFGYHGSLLLLAALLACSSSAPTVQVRNERATKANVQFKDASANTTNINDVAGGSTTAYQEVSAGAYTVTAVIQNEGVSPTTTFTAMADGSYTVVILAGATPTLRVDSH